MIGMKQSLLTVLALAAVLGLGACKGGAGSACAKPEECKRGYYCQGGKCNAGPETACGYVARCIPVMNEGDAETLFGAGFRRKLQGHSEESCLAQLRLIASMNRTVAMTRACGPRVTSAP